MENKKTTQFTTQQQQVIDHEKGNLLVSASAGSGKTRVLIAKIVDVILSGKAKLNDLLVVTFTNDASVEIKLRLSKELQNSNNEILYEQLDYLSVCDILTFDKFCIKVIREFGHTIGINSNFGVADDSLSKFLQSKALDEIISLHNKALDDNFENLLEMFFENRNEASIKNSIIKIYNFLQSKASEDNFYKNMLEKTYTNFNDSVACQFLNTKLLEIVKDFKNTLASLITKCEIISADKLLKTLKEAKFTLDCFDDNFEKNLSIILSGIDLPAIRLTKLNDEENEIKQSYNNAKTEFGKFIRQNFEDFQKFPLEIIKSDTFNTKQNLQTLFSLVDEFDIEYRALKNRYQVLDFYDIEKYANQILSNSDINLALQNKYKYIFIDEYQDTNDLQDGIIKKITTGDNLLMVGDIKQSIYRFRQAEPKIFLNKYNLYKDNTSLNSVIELNKNFRSENEILSFSNFVFDGLMKTSNVGIDYKNNSRLEFGETMQKSAMSNQVKVLLLNNDNEEKVESNLDRVYSVKDSIFSSDEFSNLQYEAEVVALEISNMLGKKYFDASTKSYKTIDYCDIAILSRRKNATVSTLKKVFGQYNIPTICSTSNNLFDNFDIELIVNILRIVNNRQNDYALISTLCCPENNISYQELAEIRRNFADAEYFYQAVDCYLEQNISLTSEKIKKVFQKIEEYKIQSYNKNISELILHIVERENLEIYFAVNNQGEQFKSNLSMLISCIDSIKHYSLSEFINYVDTFAKTLAFEIKTKQSDNAVTLSTIHASKGLEYPVVFLIDAGSKFSGKSVMEKVISENDFGISTKNFNKATRYLYAGPIHNAIKLKIKEEEKKEEMRLLYVALTRPKNYLTIVGTADLQKIETISNEIDIMKKESYLEWILGLISEKNLEQLKSGNFAVQQCENGSFDIQSLSINLLEKNSYRNNEKNSDEIKKYTTNNNFIDILSKKFEKQNLVKKNSVTRILEEEDNYNISDFSDKNTDKNGDEDFLLIGTVSHKLMELLNWTSDKENLINQLQTLLATDKINSDELKAVDINAIFQGISELSGLIEQGDIVLKEQQFTCNFPANQLTKTKYDSEVLVQGVVDLIVIKQNEIYIVDYKTSRIKNEEKLKQKYKLQLDLYAKAVEEFYGKKVTKKIIYSFYLNKPVTI